MGHYPHWRVQVVCWILVALFVAGLVLFPSDVSITAVLSMALATLLSTYPSRVSQPRSATPHRLSDAQLCCAWRTTSMALRVRTEPHERLAIAVWREEYLNEMETRNAAGFQAWIEAGECADAALEGFLVRDKATGT